MGNCVFCGNPVGFLRRAHKECTAKNESGKKYIVSLVEAAAPVKSNLLSLREKTQEISRSSYICQDDVRKLVATGWEHAVERAFDDGVLSTQEETHLSDLMEHFSLSQADVDINGAYTRLVKGAVLREILEGRLPQRIKVDGGIPFNLLKTESLVWAFPNVAYYEQRTRREYVGGSTGVSVRVARGVYLRTSAFRGAPVDHVESVRADTGCLGVTDKHVYFTGPSKSFRIKHEKIVSLTPYSDGVGLCRDGVSAKPQAFVTGDGWFTYNLLVNVGRL